MEDVNPQSVYSVQILAKLEEAFHSDYTIEAACRYAGISRTTYYNWINDVEGFAEKMEDAQNKLLQKAGEVIAKNIQAEDVATARWLKDRRDPRYKSKVEAVVSGDEQKLDDVIKDLTNDPNNLPDDSPRAEAGTTDESPPTS